MDSNMKQEIHRLVKQQFCLQKGIPMVLQFVPFGDGGGSTMPLHLLRFLVIIRHWANSRCTEICTRGHFADQSQTARIHIGSGTVQFNDHEIDQRMISGIRHR
jgi:hypothetical protein